MPPFRRPSVDLATRYPLHVSTAGGFCNTAIDKDTSAAGLTPEASRPRGHCYRRVQRLDADNPGFFSSGYVYLGIKWHLPYLAEQGPLRCGGQGELRGQEEDAKRVEAHNLHSLIARLSAKGLHVGPLELRIGALGSPHLRPSKPHPRD